MHLVISGQDLRELEVGAFDGERLVAHERIQTSPEGYLAAIDRALHQWCLGDSLTGVIVVTGPGSFTASRVSTTIANAIAFTRSLPIVALQNPKRLALADLLFGVKLQPRASVDPSYDRPPNITAPRGDNRADSSNAEMLQ